MHVSKSMISRKVLTVNIPTLDGTKKKSPCSQASNLDQKMKIHVHKKTSIFKDLSVQDLSDLRAFDLTYVTREKC